MLCQTGALYFGDPVLVVSLYLQQNGELFALNKCRVISSDFTAQLCNL